MHRPVKARMGRADASTACQRGCAEAVCKRDSGVNWIHWNHIIVATTPPGE